MYIEIQNEIWIRLFSFMALFSMIALAEYLRPKRKLQINKNIRWLRNLSILAINNIILRWLMPFTTASVAIYTQQNQLGLLQFITIPFSAKVIISILLLDLVIYAQHVAFHHIPLFWRLHKIHHIDQELDVTTGIRFHSIEIILSAFIRSAAILLFGTPFLAVILFEIILNATSMFNHANLNLPKTLDKWLRRVVVTPDMHRVHHSVILQETNSNFGFNFPWWDRIFKTYTAQPQKGHLQMDIGLIEYQNVNNTGLVKILARIPFNSKKFNSKKFNSKK